MNLVKYGLTIIKHKTSQTPLNKEICAVDSEMMMVVPNMLTS